MKLFELSQSHINMNLEEAAYYMMTTSNLRYHESEAKRKSYRLRVNFIEAVQKGQLQDKFAEERYWVSSILNPNAIGSEGSWIWIEKFFNDLLDSNVKFDRNDSSPLRRSKKYIYNF